MAKLFISYIKSDEDVARRLEQHLLEKGHRVAIPVGAAVAGNYRLKYMKALIASDAFVVVLSSAGLSSQNVCGEIGAARAMEISRGMLLLPVLVNDTGIPSHISDIYCFRLRSVDDTDFSKVASEIDKAITDNVKLAPRIFISHRHTDEPIAAALVALLEQAFHIEPNDIRCTSVKPYMLTPGERTAEQLRSDIARSELVIGVVSPQTFESDYVLCELGASWGRNVPTFPMLARGATIADVPSPLNERHSVSLESVSHCLDLIQYVASNTSLSRREAMLGRLQQLAEKLAEVSKTPGFAQQRASG